MRQQEWFALIIGTAVLVFATIATLWIHASIRAVEPPQIVDRSSPAPVANPGLATASRSSPQDGNAQDRVRMARTDPPLPVPEGYRCVGKQLFRVLPNGFDQVTDGSAKKYCR